MKHTRDIKKSTARMQSHVCPHLSSFLPTGNLSPLFFLCQEKPLTLLPAQG